MELPGPMCSLGATSESRLDSSLTSKEKKKGTLRKMGKKGYTFTSVTHQVRGVMSETVLKKFTLTVTYSSDETPRNSGTASAGSPQNMSHRATWGCL